MYCEFVCIDVDSVGFGLATKFNYSICQNADLIKSNYDDCKLRN